MTFHRMTVLFLVCLLMLAFIACTGSEKDANGDTPEDGDTDEDGDEETPLPEGCEELLVFSESVTDWPEGCDERCPFARDNSEIAFDWTFLTYRKDSTDQASSLSSANDPKTCLVAYMAQRGVSLGADLHGEAYAAGSATYTQVEPLFRLRTIIRWARAACRDYDAWPCDCCERDIDACTSPFCAVRWGDKVNRDRGCTLYTPAACVDTNGGCCGLGDGDAMTLWLDPDGNCWEFTSTCTGRPAADYNTTREQCEAFFWGNEPLPDCEE